MQHGGEVQEFLGWGCVLGVWVNEGIQRVFRRHTCGIILLNKSIETTTAMIPTPFLVWWIHVQQKISREADFTTSLGSLLQFLTTLWVKNFFLISNLNLPWHYLKPFPLILSFGMWQKRLIPTWLRSPFPQLPQLLPITLVLQNLPQPCCPSLQSLSGLLKLDAGAQHRGMANTWTGCLSGMCYLFKQLPIIFLTAREDVRDANMCLVERLKDQFISMCAEKKNVGFFWFRNKLLCILKQFSYLFSLDKFLKSGC